MNFAIIMLNVFALAAFIVFWLSLSFIAYDLYKANSHNGTAIAIARISNIFKYLLIIWFVLLGIVFTTADTPFAMIIFLCFFIGLTILTRKLYGNILNAVSLISKNDGANKSQILIYKQSNDTNKMDMRINATHDFNRLRLFIIGLDSLISVSVILNFG